MPKQNNIIAEYSLRDMSKPMGVSEYKITGNLPKDLENQFPSIEDIQNRISNNFTEDKNE